MTDPEPGTLTPGLYAHKLIPISILIVHPGGKIITKITGQPAMLTPAEVAKHYQYVEVGQVIPESEPIQVGSRIRIEEGDGYVSEFTVHRGEHAAISRKGRTVRFLGCVLPAMVEPMVEPTQVGARVSVSSASGGDENLSVLTRNHYGQWASSTEVLPWEVWIQKGWILRPYSEDDTQHLEPLQVEPKAFGTKVRAVHSNGLEAILTLTVFGEWNADTIGMHWDAWISKGWTLYSMPETQGEGRSD